MVLSIIILNYKSKNLTRECVGGILAQKLPFEYEIIVVDNGSKDGTCNMLAERFPSVRCMPLPKNIGMGAGNNAGISEAKGKYIMVLNPDTVIGKTSIMPLVEFLNNTPKAGLVAPQLLNPDKTHQPTVHKFPKFFMPAYRRTPLGLTARGKRYLKEYSVDDTRLTKPQKVDWVFGPAFIVRKSVADNIGGYDDRFFLFFEDTDLCRQIWNAGFEVWYIPQAQIIHYPHRLSAHELGMRSLFKKTTWIHIVSWLKYFWKWKRVA